MTPQMEVLNNPLITTIDGNLGAGGFGKGRSCHGAN